MTGSDTTPLTEDDIAAEAEGSRVADLLEQLCNVAEYKPPKPENSSLEQIGFFAGCCFPGCIGWLLLIPMMMSSFLPGIVFTLTAMAIGATWWCYKQRMASDGERSPAYSQFDELCLRLSDHVSVEQAPDLIRLCMTGYIQTPVPAAAVATVLPLIGSGHSALFGEDDKAGICTLTSWKYPIALRLAAIRALEHVGTGEAASTLLAIVNDPKAKEALRREAKRVLPVLQAREVSEHSSRTLLRAAEPGGQEHLLRPAGNSESEPMQLLRPASDEHIPTEECSKP